MNLKHSGGHGMGGTIIEEIEEVALIATKLGPIQKNRQSEYYRKNHIVEPVPMNTMAETPQRKSSLQRNSNRANAPLDKS